MSLIHGRALLCEPVSLVRERACQMLELAGYAPCAVSDGALFHELRAKLPFDRHVFGVRSVDRAAEAGLEREPRPLVVLAPATGLAGAADARLEVLLPGARRVDRRLAAPDALAAALAPDALQPDSLQSPEPAVTPDLVRRSFEPLGLSERQLQVTTRALLGDSTAEMARRLGIRAPTVRNHLHAIYARLDVSGRRELQGRFVRGLLRPETA